MSLGVLEAPGAYGCAMADRRGTERRVPAALRRPALRLLRARAGLRAAHAGTDRRRDGRCGRAARVRAHAPDPRAAHPAREGDVEHHDEPDAARAGRARDALVARARRGCARSGRRARRCRVRARAARPLEPAFDAPSFKEVAFRTPIPAREVVRVRASAACTPATRSAATTRDGRRPARRGDREADAGGRRPARGRTREVC